MFRERAHRTDNGGLPEHGDQGERPAGRLSRLAALLDDTAPRFGRDDARGPAHDHGNSAAYYLLYFHEKRNPER
jgi:hypothetical protein